MNKIKEFFLTIWYLISYLFTWRKDKQFAEKLQEIAEQDRRNMLTERDVEILRSVGVNTDLETLKNGGKKQDK